MPKKRVRGTVHRPASSNVVHVWLTLNHYFDHKIHLNINFPENFSRDLNFISKKLILRTKSA
jgi:hypothetical protein